MSKKTTFTVGEPRLVRREKPDEDRCPSGLPTPFHPRVLGRRRAGAPAPRQTTAGISFLTSDVFATLRTAPLRPVRRSIALGGVVANGGRARRSRWAGRVVSDMRSRKDHTGSRHRLEDALGKPLGRRE